MPRGTEPTDSYPCITRLSYISVFLTVFLGKGVGDLTHISHLLGIPHFWPEHWPKATETASTQSPSVFLFPLLHELFYVGSGPRMPAASTDLYILLPVLIIFFFSGLKFIVIFQLDYDRSWRRSTCLLLGFYLTECLLFFHFTFIFFI